MKEFYYISRYIYMHYLLKIISEIYIFKMSQKKQPISPTAFG